MILISKTLTSREMVTDNIPKSVSEQFARSEFRKVVNDSFIWNHIEIDYDDKFIRCRKLYDDSFGLAALKPEYHKLFEKFDYRVVYDSDESCYGFKLVLNCNEDDLVLERLSGNEMIEDLLSEGTEIIKEDFKIVANIKEHFGYKRLY